MAATTTKKCTCTNEFQDREHGHGWRLHNLGSKDEARCTVCGAGRPKKKPAPGVWTKS